MMLRVVNPHDSQHFRDRLFTRFGILLTASDMWPLRDQLCTLKPVKIEDGVATYLMRLQGRVVYVLYGIKQQRFVTATQLNHTETMEAARLK
jgi:hypothetical protein